MADVRVIISADPSADLEAVLREAAARGLSGGAVLPKLRTLTGAIASDRLGDLRSIGGVIAVEAEQRYQLPPDGRPQ